MNSLNAEAIPFTPHTTGALNHPSTEAGDSHAQPQTIKHADPLRAYNMSNFGKTGTPTIGNNKETFAHKLTQGLTTTHTTKNNHSAHRAAAGVTGLAGGITMAGSATRKGTKADASATGGVRADGTSVSTSAQPFLVQSPHLTQKQILSQSNPAQRNSTNATRGIGVIPSNEGIKVTASSTFTTPDYTLTSSNMTNPVIASLHFQQSSALSNVPAPNLATRLPSDGPLHQFLLRSVEYIPYKSRTLFGVSEQLKEQYGHEVGPKGLAAIRAAEENVVEASGPSPGVGVGGVGAASPISRGDSSGKAILIIHDQLPAPTGVNSTTLSAHPSNIASAPTIRKFTRFRCVNLWPGRTTSQWCQDVKKLLCRYGAPKEIVVKYAQRSSHTQEFIFDVTIDATALLRHTATQTVQQLAEALIARVQAGRDVMGFSGIFHLKTRGQAADLRLFSQLTQYFGFTDAQAIQRDNIAFWSKHLTPAVYISSRASSHQVTPLIPLNSKGSTATAANNNSPSPGVSSVTPDPLSGADVFDSANVRAQMLEIEREEKERELHNMLSHREATEQYLGSPRNQEPNEASSEVQGPRENQLSTNLVSDINTIDNIMALYGINRSSGNVLNAESISRNHKTVSSDTTSPTLVGSASSVGAAGLGQTKPSLAQIEQTHKELPVFLINPLSSKIENPMDYHDNNVHEQCSPWCDYYPYSSALGKPHDRDGPATPLSSPPQNSSTPSSQLQTTPSLRQSIIPAPDGTSVANHPSYRQLIFMKVQNLPFEREDHFGALIHEIMARCMIVTGCFNGLTLEEVVGVTHVEQRDMKPQNLQPTPDRPKSRTITEFMFVISFLVKEQWPDELKAKHQPDTHFLIPLMVPPRCVSRTSPTAGTSTTSSSFLVTSTPTTAVPPYRDTFAAQAAASQNHNKSPNTPSSTSSGAELARVTEYYNRGLNAIIGTSLQHLNELEQYRTVHTRIRLAAEHAWMIKYAVRTLAALQRMPILLDRNGFWMTRLDNAEALGSNKVSSNQNVSFEVGNQAATPTKLQSDLLMEGEGRAWDGHNINEFNVNSCRTMSYCQQIGYLMQKHRHFLLDGLPCMPLRVKTCDLGCKPHYLPLTSVVDAENLHQLPVATTPYPQLNTDPSSPNFTPADQILLIEFSMANQRALAINQERLSKKKQALSVSGIGVSSPSASHHQAVSEVSQQGSTEQVPPSTQTDMLPTDAAVTFTRESIIAAWPEVVKYHLPASHGLSNGSNVAPAIASMKWGTNALANTTLTPKLAESYYTQQQVAFGIHKSPIQVHTASSLEAALLAQQQQPRQHAAAGVVGAAQQRLLPPSYEHASSSSATVTNQNQQFYRQPQQLSTATTSSSQSSLVLFQQQVANKTKELCDTLKELEVLLQNGALAFATASPVINETVSTVLRRELSDSGIPLHPLYSAITAPNQHPHFAPSQPIANLAATERLYSSVVSGAPKQSAEVVDASANHRHNNGLWGPSNPEPRPEHTSYTLYPQLQAQVPKQGGEPILDGQMHFGSFVPHTTAPLSAVSAGPPMSHWNASVAGAADSLHHDRDEGEDDQISIEVGARFVSNLLDF